MKPNLLSKLKLNQLECFHEVVRLNSFSRAAKALGISQPSVSGAVKKLEAELNTQLLQRSSNGFQLTDCGKIVYEHSCAVIEHLSRMEEDLTESVSPGVSTIRFGSCVFEDVIIEDVSSFLSKHPNINIALENRNMGKVSELVLEGYFDLAVIPSGALGPGMLSVPYRKIEFGLQLPPGHPLAQHEAISPEMLRGENILIPPFQESIVASVVRYKASHGTDFQLSPAPMARNLQTLRFMVNEGCGIGLFPLPERGRNTEQLNKDTQFTRRFTSPLFIDFSIAWKKDKFITVAQKTLIEHLCNN